MKRYAEIVDLNAVRRQYRNCNIAKVRKVLETSGGNSISVDKHKIASKGPNAIRTLKRCGQLMTKTPGRQLLGRSSFQVILFKELYRGMFNTSYM